MSLFGNKKRSGDSLKTLSEKEIQDKLYGRFRTMQHAVGDEQGFLPPPRKQDSQQQKSPSSSIASDMLRKTESIQSPQHSSKPHQHENSHISKHPEMKESVTEWLSQEDRVLKSHMPASVINKAEQKKKMKVSKPIPQPNKTGALILGALKSIALSVLETVRYLIGKILSLFIASNYRNPKTRRNLYLGAAGLALLAVMMGVHFLNVQREAAMRRPIRPLEIENPFVEEHAAAPATTTETVSEESQTQASQTTTEAPAPVTVKTPKSQVQETAPVAEEAVAGKYAIQIATYALEADSDRVTKQLKDAGEPAFKRPLRRGNGKTYYCIFIGGFATNREAETALTEFKKKPIAKPFTDAFVRSI